MTAEYPPRLLSESVNARYEYFRSCLARHHHLECTLRELMLEIEQPTDELLTLVVGTTGVGKTTLRDWAAQELTKKVRPEEEPSRVPVVSVEAVGSDTRGFSLRDLLDREAAALSIPMWNRVTGSSRPVVQGSPLSRDPQYRAWQAIETALKERKPYAVFIDEAQVLSKMSGGRTFVDQIDMYKAMTNTTRIPHVLFGTYELLGLVYSMRTAQLLRRCNILNFPRYGHTQEDMAYFQDIVYFLQSRLPLAIEPDLVSHTVVLHQASLGIIAYLKKMMLKALREALNKGAETIDIRTVLKYAPNRRTRDETENEAKEGERILDSLQSPDDYLDPPQRYTSDTERQTRKKRGKPGERKPHRDRTGYS